MKKKQLFVFLHNENKESIFDDRLMDIKVTFEKIENKN